MSKSYRIAAVPGDGIGHEIVPAGLKVLKEVAEKFNFQTQIDHFGFGAGHYKQHGVFMPEGGLSTLQAYDAILFGAVGLPDVDDTLPAKDYTFKVRTHFEQYVNYRPVRNWKGVQRPLRDETPFDFIVVRENTEGEFVQVGSQVRPDSAHGMGLDTSIFTRAGIERIAHYAFRLAGTRRKHVTTVTKSNTLINSLTYWDRVIGEVAEQYPEIEHRYMYIDATSANFVLRPWIFDVVLTTNLFGDILSDLGGALMGSLGLGGSGNINPEKEFPSMFEPIHGSAPDIAGRGISNPVGMFWSVALMLEHLGETEAAEAIMDATDMALEQGFLPIDIGGKTGTDELAEKVASNIK
jgi:tartrate dehydrogenase/decarboxylase / D-malate dehydrogenase